MHVTQDDDFELGLYYIRCLSNVLRWSPEPAWAVLAKKTIRSTAYFPPLSEISKFPPSTIFPVPRSNEPSWER